MIGEHAVFARNSDEWETPDDVFDALDKEFHFTLDPCATDENHKCIRYFTKEKNGLDKDWSGEVVYCNPPYSQIRKWVEKGYREGLKDNTTVVLLIPARTDTIWFHNYILHRSEIRFISGRIRFVDAEYNAPFPSMVVIFRGART